jgi:NAD(P)-dependent dehydrogenase (short-subunit alcohol dehydrogenase family)
VVVTDLNPDACTRVADELRSEYDVDALGIAADITQHGELTVLRDRILDRFGKLDVLVNNAALNDKVEGRDASAPVSFEKFPLEQWKRAVDVNLTGTFLCCQVFGELMASGRSGSIINVASTYGIVGPDQRIYRDDQGRQTLFKSPAYSATKAAIIGLTKYLAAYYGPTGVRVNTLSPGGVKTTQDEWFVSNYSERTPLGRMATPEDYRGAIVYLASDASSYVTGTNLIVDGGWTAW